MMEQSDACECHCDAVLVARINHMIITNAATSLGYIFHTTLVSTFDIIAEWEEGIATEAHLGVLSQPCFLFLTGEWGRFLSEEFSHFRR